MKNLLVTLAVAIGGIHPRLPERVNQSTQNLADA
jgi:hypothetical protein